MATTIERAGRRSGSDQPLEGRGPRWPRAVSHRRKPSWVVAGVLMVAGSSLAFAVWARSMDERRPVVALGRAVEAGEVLTPGHLLTVEVGAHPELELLSPEAASDLHGRRAVADLPAGILVQRGMFTDTSLAEAGEAIVGLSLPAGELPLGGLRVGDAVLAVETPDGLVEGPRDESPAVWPATVAAFIATVDDAGIEQMSVSLRVDVVDAPPLAAAAARHAVRLVLVSELDGVPWELLGEGPSASGGGPPPEPHEATS